MYYYHYLRFLRRFLYHITVRCECNTTSKLMAEKSMLIQYTMSEVSSLLAPFTLSSRATVVEKFLFLASCGLAAGGVHALALAFALASLSSSSLVLVLTFASSFALSFSFATKFLLLPLGFVPTFALIE